MSATAQTPATGVTGSLTPALQPSPSGRRRAWNRIGIELSWVLGMLALYNFGRYIAKNHVGPAFHNAIQVWDFERWLRIPSEQAFQSSLLHAWPWGVEAANSYYATAHFPVTLAFLVWMFIRRPDYYLWIRRTLVILTSAALVGHLAFPLAPPRMLPQLGFVDTGILYNLSVYGAHGANSIANQYAAMPSLHVAWAALVAVGLIVSTNVWWRWFWLIHPAITLAVVVVTANHYWLDGIIGLILLAIALAVTVRARPDPAQASASDEATDSSADHDADSAADATSADSAGDATSADEAGVDSASAVDASVAADDAASEAAAVPAGADRLPAADRADTRPESDGLVPHTPETVHDTPAAVPDTPAKPLDTPELQR